MPKFQVYKDAAGKFRFRLIAGNNQIVAVGEAYEQRAGCMNGIRSIQKNCSAEIEDLTIKDRKVPNPKFQIYKDAADKFRFRLKAPNGEIIAEGEGYESKEGCLNGIKVVKSSCEAEIEDLSVPKKTSQENVVPAKVQEIASPKTEAEDLPDNERLNVPTASLDSETKAAEEAPLPEAKTEVLPQPTPIAAAEKDVPLSSGQIDTKLELYAAPDNITKGNSVSFRGMLSATDSGKGVAGVEIRIYESRKSIFGDDWLALGRTNQDGAFDISWKARSLFFRKNTGNIYAKFAGNERAKPSKSPFQSINIK